MASLYRFRGEDVAQAGTIRASVMRLWLALAFTSIWPVEKWSHKCTSQDNFNCDPIRALMRLTQRWLLEKWDFWGGHKTHAAHAAVLQCILIVSLIKGTYYAWGYFTSRSYYIICNIIIGVKVSKPELHTYRNTSRPNPEVLTCTEHCFCFIIYCDMLTSICNVSKLTHSLSKRRARGWCEGNCLGSQCAQQCCSRQGKKRWIDVFFTLRQIKIDALMNK